MKKLIAMLAFVFGATLLFAQEEAGAPATDVTYVSATAKIDKYHNEVDLEKLGKLELTELYLERVSVVTEIIPYLALHKNPAGATLADLGIPETKANVSRLEKEVKSKLAYLEAIRATLHDIIPYADKRNIIWSILFLEEVIHKIEKAAKAEAAN